jgi:hypothetical protein
VSEGASDRAFRRAVRPSLASLVRIVRGFLWLRGERRGQSPDDMISQVEANSGTQLPGLRNVVAVRGNAGWGGFERLYHEVDELTNHADPW